VAGLKAKLYSQINFHSNDNRRPIAWSLFNQFDISNYATRFSFKFFDFGFEKLFDLTFPLLDIINHHKHAPFSNLLSMQTSRPAQSFDKVTILDPKGKDLREWRAL